MKYNYDFKIFKDGIVLETFSAESQVGGPREEISTRLFDTREEGFRRALIEMGWTPPKEKIKEKHLKVFPSRRVFNYAVGHAMIGTEFSYTNKEDVLIYKTFVSKEEELLKLRGTQWDDIWIHPDVTWGMAQEILLLKRK